MKLYVFVAQTPDKSSRPSRSCTGYDENYYYLHAESFIYINLFVENQYRYISRSTNSVLGELDELGVVFVAAANNYMQGIDPTVDSRYGFWDAQRQKRFDTSGRSKPVIWNGQVKDKSRLIRYDTRATWDAATACQGVSDDSSSLSDSPSEPVDSGIPPDFRNRQDPNAGIITTPPASSTTPSPVCDDKCKQGRGNSMLKYGGFLVFLGTVEINTMPVGLIMGRLQYQRLRDGF
ncbi:uncharacterized protein B0H64DRAFT_374513 [Chaetomium fimeti]|uniref:Uncharacterized protein n=1 Tax=Chaetomium fimeti TaxID=1854472 RepID=A0AAE0HH89_9PEZI|nr:hypothetical protein B0H64DRAFT_374513 [Chaetomium fimeti]